MDDVAHKWTDEQIADLEERVRLAYRSAQIDVQGKLYKFLRRFERDNEKYRQQAKDGKITQATYRDWLRGQIFQRRRWRALLDALTDTLANANELAMQIINDAVPAVMAYNANWATYQIEHASNIDTGFVLYDQNTVARLLRDEPNLLPPSTVDIPKDKRWNSKLITAQINQGIIQGEALETIARRLARVVTGMNINQARTHARTAMTGAQNAGREEGYKRAEAMGINLEREWIATLDYHTRTAHGILDGQSKPNGVPFVVTYRYGKHVVTDSIMYPGDPSAPGRMVYNCRCTTGAKLLDYPDQNAMRRPNLQELGDALVQKPIKDMTYAEWIGWKKEAQKVLKTGRQRGIMQSEDIDVPRSLGAKATNFDIDLPDGEIVHLTEGTRITQVQVIAGKGRTRQIDEIDHLMAKWGGQASEWQKKKGIGYVDYEGESYRAELHWYEEPTVGRHKWKVKPDADGNWFLDD